MPIVRGSYAALLAPGLNYQTFSRFKEKPEKYRAIVNVKDSKRAYEEGTGMTGFGPMSETTELEFPLVDKPIQLGLVRWIHKTFQLAIVYSKEMRDDEQYGIISQLAGLLGRSARYTAEIWGHDVYNYAFSTARYTCRDGKSLFATDHPIEGQPGVTIANMPAFATDLSATALEAAIQAFENQVDYRGMNIESMARTLVVTPENRMLAKRILQSTNYPGSMLNDLNPLNDENLVIHSTPYIVDKDQWMVLGQTSELGVTFYWREMTDTATWDETGPDATYHKIRQRHSINVDEWRHTYGSAGA